MLEKLEIENFRGILNGKIELSPLTVLLGPNNSGKSSILEAAFLVPNPLRNAPYYVPPDRSRAERSSTVLDVVGFLHESLNYRGYAFLTFRYLGKTARIKCSVTGEPSFILDILTSKKNIVFRGQKGLSKESNAKSHVIDIGRASRTSLDIFKNNLAPQLEETLLVSATLTRLGFQYLQDNWITIVNSGITRRIATEVSPLSADDYNDFTLEPFVGGDLELLAYFKDGTRIRIGDIGEGIKIYIVARSLFETTNPSVLLWDDIESHLNPRMLLHIAQWFGDLISKKKQVIISTHSLEAARILAGVNEEKSSILVTALDDSILKTKKLSLSELEDFKKAGIDPRTSEAMLL